ncbi:MAG: AAA family ATPase [Chloroflexota bacterium]|nr:AAA family ATPase [Chloroflexota bacterium]
MLKQSGNDLDKEFMPILIIISGPPASGKTYLGQRIAHNLQLPFFNKDGIKELLFDNLGWSDAVWSRKLNAASLDILYYFVAVQLAVGRTQIVESNFKPELDTARFLALQEQYPCEFVQIQCVTEGEVLLERFRQRAKIGRHPGHVDHEIESYLQPLLLRGRHGKLEIGGSLFEVDTTDFAKIDYAGLFQAISAIINRISE